MSSAARALTAIAVMLGLASVPASAQVVPGEGDGDIPIGCETYITWTQLPPESTQASTIPVGIQFGWRAIRVKGGTTSYCEPGSQLNLAPHFSYKVNGVNRTSYFSVASPAAGTWTATASALPVVAGSDNQQVATVYGRSSTTSTVVAAQTPCQYVLQVNQRPSSPTSTPSGYFAITFGNVHTTNPSCPSLASDSAPQVLVNGVNKAALLTYQWNTAPGQLNQGSGSVPLKVGFNTIIISQCVGDFAGGLRADTTRVRVLGGPPGLPVVASAMPTQLGIERSACLQMGIAQRISTACGSVILAHPLPAVRTYGKTRSPALYFDSDLASPTPLIRADVTLGGGMLPADTVELIVRARRAFTADAWAFKARKVFVGAAWQGGESRRVAVALPSESDSTGVYEFQLEVAHLYALDDGTWNRQAAAAVYGNYIVVNRRSSRYGPGWWVAGVETLKDIDADRKLWIGGDGSARLFTRRPGAPSIWDGPKLDGPDSLVSEWDGMIGNIFTPRLPSGTRVVFDDGGRHRTTVNSQGHVTSLTYNGAASTADGRYLSAIQVPGWSGPTYSFFYRDAVFGSTLFRVAAPNLDVPERSVFVIDSAAWNGTGRPVVAIQDPDQLYTRFRWSPVGPQLLGRRDKTNADIQLTYHWHRQLKEFAIERAANDYARTTVWDHGTAATPDASPALTSDAYVLVDGANLHHKDHTRFWLQPLGNVSRIQNAKGFATIVSFDSASFPLLPTRVEQPTGQVLTSVLNPQGLVIQSIDWATTGTRTYAAGCPLAGTSTGPATTTYEYDLRWSEPTVVCGPSGERNESLYDTNGNATWTQDVRGATSRTKFYYYAGSNLLRSVYGPGSRPDSLEYDALNNMRALHGVDYNPGVTPEPLRPPKYFANNNAGFTREVKTFVTDAEWGGNYSTLDSTTYDVMGRVRKQIFRGPQDQFTDYTSFGTAGGTQFAMQIGAPRIERAKGYDAEGRVIVDSVDASRAWNNGTPVRTTNPQTRIDPI